MKVGIKLYVFDAKDSFEDILLGVVVMDTLEIQHACQN